MEEICREGARHMLAGALEAEADRHMLAGALEAEADRHMAQFVSELDDRGHRLVVRNGHAPPRMVATAAGTSGLHGPNGSIARAAAPSGSVVLPKPNGTITQP